jgi:diguanylate cyclase (GGDEF)-like protein
MVLDMLNKLNAFACISDVQSNDVLYVNDYGLEKLGMTMEQATGLKSDKLLSGSDIATDENIKCGQENKFEYFANYDGRDIKIEIYFDKCVGTGSIGSRDEKYILKCMNNLYEYTEMKDFVLSVLRVIKEYYGADQVIVYELSEDASSCKKSYEVHDGDEKFLIDKPELTETKLGFWLNKLKNHDCMVLSSECICDKEILESVFDGKLGKSIDMEIVSALKINGIIFGGMVVVNPKICKDNPKFLMNASYFISNEVQKRRTYERLQHLSFYDPLTNLRNRNSYDEYRKEYEHSHRDSVGVAYLDINGLKELNEVYGAEYGDNVIKHIAEVICKYLPKENTEVKKFRIDGDEFLIVWENCDYNNFIDVITKMEEELKSKNEESITCGYIWSKECNQLEKLVAKADELMHIKKHKYYENHLNSHSRTPEFLSVLLRELREGKYVIYLQPKNSIKNNDEVYGAEALIRYKDKTKGVIAPYKFIPIFEREKIISYIDFFVFEEVCKLLNTWKNKGEKKLIVSLNFSRISLMEGDFVERVESIAKKYNIDKDLLELEVTETTETLDRVHMIEVINSLKKKGFRISLDDFGCEYSSMDMLLAFDVDVIKIDKSLIDEITNSRKNKILVSHICQMSTDMGVETIAEGVETHDQYELLKGIGCECVQGYLFGRPMPVDDFEKNYLQIV